MVLCRMRMQLVKNIVGTNGWKESYESRWLVRFIYVFFFSSLHDYSMPCETTSQLNEDKQIFECILRTLFRPRFFIQSEEYTWQLRPISLRVGYICRDCSVILFIIKVAKIFTKHGFKFLI